MISKFILSDRNHCILINPFKRNIALCNGAFPCRWPSWLWRAVTMSNDLHGDDYDALLQWATTCMELIMTHCYNDMELIMTSCYNEQRLGADYDVLLQWATTWSWLWRAVTMRNDLELIMTCCYNEERLGADYDVLLQWATTWSLLWRAVTMSNDSGIVAVMFVLFVCSNIFINNSSYKQQACTIANTAEMTQL